MIDVGQTVGNYNITAKLGEGGMGTVFLAQHPVIGSKVALKAVHPAPATRGNQSVRTPAIIGTQAPPATVPEITGSGSERNDLAPPRHRAGIFFLGVVALAVVAATNTGMRQQATRLLFHSAALKSPATVRVNFTSDPSGAIVSRSDGSVLGVTPLSVTIPYGDTPVDYRVHKDGYGPKVSSLVPNLPSPVFVLLERLEQPEVAPSSPQAAAASLADVLPPTQMGIMRRGRHHHRATRPYEPIDDGDDVMPPSTE
jgi:hypothetical protein